MQLSDKQKAEGWRIVKFGDVAEHISKRINPTIEDSARYIGLEHLDSGSIRVSRWGTDIALKGQKLEMKKGDILFAKRNAYLKRVAIAPFDGIFSAHGMVLRPHGNLIMHDFLPFFMQSDMFMERAVAISEGSLSPTIKWKTLARQEFAVPSCTRQDEIVKLMQKFEINIALSDESIAKADQLLHIAISKFINSENQSELTLNDLGVFYGGLTGKTKDDFESGNEFFIPYTNVFNNFSIDINDFREVKITKNESQNKVLYGDVIFTLSSETPNDVGMSSVMTDKENIDLYLNSFCVGFRPHKNKIMPKFSKYFFRSANFRKKIIALSQGSTRFNISRKALGKIKIALPKVEQQSKIANILREFEESLIAVKAKNNLIKKLKSKALAEAIK